jgi:hypothetical protein
MTSSPLLKRLAAGEDAFRDLEPLQLWLLPIHLRSRRQFYEDAVAQAQRRIEGLWATQGFLFASRDEFDGSASVENVWRSLSPPWWGLNDIVGFIDVRMHATEIATSLFTTTKRATRVLKHRTYVFRRSETVPVAFKDSNRTLRPAVVAAVQTLAQDPSVAGRYLDLSRWRPLVEHMDLAALYRATFAHP